MGARGSFPVPPHADRTPASGYKCSMVPRTREGHIREGALGPSQVTGEKVNGNSDFIFHRDSTGDTQEAAGAETMPFRSTMCVP